MTQRARIAFRTLLILGPLVGGCSMRTVEPDAALLEAAHGGPPYLYSDADWAEVLSRHVRAGLVDYQRLAENPSPLKRYYALLTRTGPTLTPDQFPARQQAVAYWINAYNALVLLVVLEHYPISTVYDLSLPTLDFDYTFNVDGRPRTLAEIQNTALEAGAGDVRVLFAMCGAALGTPRLADQPIRGSLLERQLSEAAARGLESPSLLSIDHSSQRVLVWQEVLRRQEAFLEYWRTRRRVPTAFLFNVLLELASPAQRRALQSAVGYQFREMPFDRSLNDASPGSPATRAE